MMSDTKKILTLAELVALTDNEIIDGVMTGTIPGDLGKLAMAEKRKTEAATRSGSVKEFAIATSEKGQYVLTLPGHGFPVCVGPEGMTAIIANIDAVKKLHTTDNGRLTTLRNAYKQTEDYKASAAKAFKAAGEAKAKSKASAT